MKLFLIYTAKIINFIRGVSLKIFAMKTETPCIKAKIEKSKWNKTNYCHFFVYNMS